MFVSGRGEGNRAGSERGRFAGDRHFYLALTDEKHFLLGW